MREVTFCDRSTIAEAWAVLRGRPVPIVSEEAAALAYAAKLLLPELEREPATVVAEVPRSGPVSPFWNQQWSWDGGRLRARIGHRYLSVHRFADDEHRYETYERSLQPALSPWLDACAQIYGGPLVLPAVADVSYGYINSFLFPQAGFDISQKFRLTFGLGIDGLSQGLEGLAVEFHYKDNGPDNVRSNAHVTVQVAARPEQDDHVRVRTVTYATLALNHRFWKDKMDLEAAIQSAKSAAKRAFFELATAETHLQMGAHYGDSD